MIKLIQWRHDFNSKVFHALWQNKNTYQLIRRRLLKFCTENRTFRLCPIRVGLGKGLAVMRG